ncbi:MarR family transcriptional regulator, partial [bacterium]
KHIGLLEEGLLHSPFSLTEARVVFELAQKESITPTELGNELAVDPGYMSRILARFENQGLLSKTRSETDGRQVILRLTATGREAYATINSRSQAEVKTILKGLSAEEQNRLVAAMGTIEKLMGGPCEQGVPYILRPHQAGDMGWVVYRHGVLYAQEYGWDEQFEALVAEITAKFIQNFYPRRERCWIAEKDGENVGSVFLVKATDTTAKLRLLLVEPKARGLGIGARLVDECIRFARHSGYTKMTLWTNSVLLAARKIYEKAGFRVVHTAPHHSFGHDLVEETWELDL